MYNLKHINFHKKKLYGTALSIFLAGYTTQVSADIFDNCASAIANGNEEQIRQFASDIKNMQSIPYENWASASECVSAASGIHMTYDALSSQFLTDVELEKVKIERNAAKQERLAREEEQRLERERQEAAIQKVQDDLRRDALRRQAANNRLITTETYSACKKLYKHDEVAAMTNATCINSFDKMGHPKLESYLEKN